VGGQSNASRKLTKKEFDCDQARMCVCQDCIGSDPLFGRQFEHVFRVTRAIFQQVWDVAAKSDSFFAHLINQLTRKVIFPEVKVSMGFKLLAFGISPIAFSDCFQMGETAACKCVTKLAHAVSHDKDLWSKCLRKPTKADTKAISDPHEQQFGCAGTMGCLGCMHVHWRTCPKA